MKKYNANVTFLNCYSLNCSMYGNPKGEIFLQFENGTTERAKTANDSLAGWCYRSYERKQCNIDYHYTKNGNMIITYISDIERM